jgi:hypothetical protein
MDTYLCPEGERFLDQEDIERNHTISFTRGECIKNYFWGNCEGSCNQQFLDYSEYYLLLEYALTDGMFEHSTEEIQNVNGQIIKIEKKVKGFFVDETEVRAVISEIANEDFLPVSIKTALANKIPVEATYEGLQYLLAKTKDKIYPYTLSYYESFKEIIRCIDLHYHCSIKEISIGEPGSILILDTGETKFIIAGLLGEEQTEEERGILISKIESAKPFFEFKPIRKVNWNKLLVDKGDTFEKLVESLLPLEKTVIEVKSIGKTRAADRGRDFIVLEKSNNALGNIVEKKWLVQCKFSEHSISTKTIPDWATRVLEHNCDGFWLMTNNDLTPDLIDQLNDVERNNKHKIETKFWQRNTFDIKLATHPEVFASDILFEQ